MAKTWQEILDDPYYAGVVSNIQTSLTLAAQETGANPTFGINQQKADYGKPTYSATPLGAVMTPELAFLSKNPKTVMQVLASSTADLTPQQRQAIISGAVGSMGQKWGGTEQKTAGEILEERLQKLGELESNKQGWLPNVVALAAKMAESKNVDVGGLLSTVGQTMEDDEWSPYDD
jgi:hypothetical protein